MAWDREQSGSVCRGARLGGGYITSNLVPISCGVDLVRAAVQLALGEEPDLRERPGGTRGAAVRFLAPPPGRIRAIHGLEQARRSAGVRQLVLHMAVGQWVPELMSVTPTTL